MSTRKRVLILTSAGVLCVAVIIAVVLAIKGSRPKDEIDDETRRQLDALARHVYSGKLDKPGAVPELLQIATEAQQRNRDDSEVYLRKVMDRGMVLIENAWDRRIEEGRE